MSITHRMEMEKCLACGEDVVFTHDVCPNCRTPKSPGSLPAPAPPPPLPRAKRPASDRRAKALIGLAVVVVVFLVVLVGLRIVGLICPFSVPTGAMAPAVSPGDHFMMESFTYLARKPHHGDLIVFKTEGIPSLPADQTFIKRVAGEPGERVRISDGKLYVNDKHVPLRNAAGEIGYVSLPGSQYLSSSTDSATVPEDHYFVLGDNSANSSDSRSWGFVPARNIKGRASLCYWPLDRMGAIK
jgi:signal peptidase I